MLRTFLRSEIHRAMVTGGDLNYVGSLTMSPGLLEAADIGVHELVQVVNINNGARIIDPAAAETADPAGSGGAVRLPTERIRTFVVAWMVIEVGLTVIAFAVAGRRVWWLVRLAFSGQPAPERVTKYGWAGR